MAGPVQGASTAAALAAGLDGWLEAARTTWPGVKLDGGRFAAHIAAHLDAEASDPAPVLDRLRAADLYLACACLQGDPAALQAFAGHFLSAVPAAVRRIDSAPAFADEVRQLLSQRLLVGGAGSPPRLATYSGRGSLAAWVAVAAQRIALDLARQRRPEVPLQDDVALALSSAGGPEVELMRAQYRELFEEGLRRGLGSLSPRDRTVLRLNLVANVSLQTIARSYGVNQSTVSRWVAQARDAILDALKLHLQGHLQASDLGSIVRLVRSQIDVAMSTSGLRSDDPA